MAFKDGDIFFRWEIEDANRFNRWLDNVPTMDARELNQVLSVTSAQVLASRGVRRRPTPQELEEAGQMGLGFGKE